MIIEGSSAANRKHERQYETDCNINIILKLLYGCNSIGTTEKPAFNKLGFDSAADTYTVASEDSEMNTAIIKAKQTLIEFETAFNRNDTLLTDFAVKKRYLTDSNGGEHMWVAVFAIENGKYKGVINNDAEKTTQVKYGDTVFVRKNEITDWMYLDKNVLKGGYTILEIRSHLNKEEQTQMDSAMGIYIPD